MNSVFRPMEIDMCEVGWTIDWLCDMYMHWGKQGVYPRTLLHFMSCNSQGYVDQIVPVFTIYEAYHNVASR